jgi:hypothetical protein
MSNLLKFFPSENEEVKLEKILISGPPLGLKGSTCCAKSGIKKKKEKTTKREYFFIMNAME